jgi:hypothetical protein
VLQFGIMKNQVCCFMAGVLLLAAVMPLAALDKIRIDAGLVYQVNSEEDSAPSPLMPAAGIVLPWKAFGRLPGEIGFLTFGTYYRLEGDRALPAEQEHRDFWVQGIMAGLRLGPEFAVGEKLTLGLQGGLSLLLRLPVPLAGAAGDFGGLASYFYGGFRLLYPEAGLFAELPIRERLSLRLSARAGIPIFHLWDGEDVPFTDQLLAGLLLGFVWRLP